MSGDRKYYSQHGEDIILWSLFGDDRFKGYFLDVGALDGRRFNNTLSFEEAGWTGVCVEAHPDYIDLLRDNRPNSKIVHAAVTDRCQDKIDFYANSRGTLSTLDKSLEENFKGYGKYFTGFKKIRVPGMTLDSILGNEFANVDLVSIDIEGGEIGALKGFSIERYFPRVVVIEILDTKRSLFIASYMKEHRYYPARAIGGNTIYCRYEEDIEIIKAALIDKKLIHTKHPLD
jgi:FkbM family methyltransferase